jgi:hypothetical protein
MSDKNEYIMQLVNHAAYAIEDGKGSVKFDFPFPLKDKVTMKIRIGVRLDQFKVQYKSIDIKGDTIIINL